MVDAEQLYNEGNVGKPTTPGIARVPPPVPVTEVVLTRTPPVAPLAPPVVPQVPPSNQAQVLSLTRNLSLGMRGDDVAKLQSYLMSHGLLAPSLASGYYGELTKQSVVKLQTKHGLPATGYLGVMTRAKLDGVSVDALSAVAHTPAPALPSGDKSAQIMQMMNLISDLQRQLAELRAKGQ